MDRFSIILKKKVPVKISRKKKNVASKNLIEHREDREKMAFDLLKFAKSLLEQEVKHRGG